jgi:hypothetical protein
VSPDQVTGTYRLLAAVIYKLGKERGVDATAIRCALAMTLVGVCAAASAGGPASALSDVLEAIAVRAERDDKRRRDAS